jgi:hypothetical protein
VVVSVGLTLDRDVIAVEGEVGGLAEPVRARFAVRFGRG